MRYLVLSDVHGNRFGLEAVLEDAKGEYDRLLCLGDVVGYGAHPNECCAILRERSAECLSGNHDAAALGLISIEWFNDVATAAILWTRKQLSPENSEWLRALPGQRDFAESNFEAVHGSLRQPWEEYITDASIAEPNLLLMKQPLCLFGHTHVAGGFRAPLNLDEWTSWDQLIPFAFPHGGEIELEPKWRYLLNPGSCGQPRDGNPQARYALLNVEEEAVEVRAVDYDVNGARAAIIRAGLPQFLGDRLLRGQ